MTMFNEPRKHTIKPRLYTPSLNKFWDDEDISKGMLEAHLDPNWDAATRKPKWLDKFLLDLGCGPGLYAE